MAADKVNIKFVQEVQKYPCLYDTGVPGYSRREATDMAWDEIGEKFQMTGVACREKWKNIRNVFVRHLRPTYHESGKFMNKPYYLEEYLQFTKPFIKPSVLNNYNPVKKNKVTRVNNALDEDANVNALSTSSQNESKSSTPKSNPPEPELKSASQSLRSPSELQVPEENTLKRKYDGCEQNSNKMFLLSLVSDMNQMNDKQRRIFKRKVLSLVDEIIDSDSDDTNTHRPSNIEYISTTTPKNSSEVYINENITTDEITDCDSNDTNIHRPSKMYISSPTPNNPSACYINENITTDDILSSGENDHDHVYIFMDDDKSSIIKTECEDL